MNCPQCKHEQVCGCPPCYARNPVEKTYQWVNGEDIACGNCGWVMGADEWHELGYAEYRNRNIVGV